MTPQEQIEELARKWEAQAAEMRTRSQQGAWAAQARKEDAADLRAIRFDSPQISEGMVEAGVRFWFGPEAKPEQLPDYRRRMRELLSAALAQKGEA